ncbi:citrate/2-methylcitrate synthase [Vulcanisaeta sp. JCM 14467]|uniref:citrate/2-methylcitrate synthase n=1 Tax=Vulcanisaeta sp. JCM 14467 TaxID=1295370 RepID=UPI0006D259BB|nr:citrate/2-methylcitrate synthase [Vulcanisaeta sp. JCM 14467]
MPKPRHELNHVANYFYMFFDGEPSDGELRTLEYAAERHLSHKGVHANTDLYASLVYYTLGFPMEYNPVNFALVRIVGRIAPRA